MSLRFLTRRRDRPSSSKSSSVDTSPASTLSPLPPIADPSLRKGKAATIPTEVQIISWDPKELEKAGREVHISSRAETDTFPTLCQTPVYAAFTAAARGWKEENEAKTEEDERHGGHSRGGSDFGHTYFAARDVPRRDEPKRTRPKTAPRLATSTWTVFDEPTSISIPPPAAASDTPTSEVVEELSGSLGGLRVVEHDEEAKKGLPIIRLSSKARRAKARSHHAHVSGAYAVDLGDGKGRGFDGAPLSLPAETGGLGFLHRNASVSSFKDMIAGSESSGSTGLLARITPRRSKNATATQNEESSGVGARSESLGSITKLLRSKDSSKTGKSRNAAPPSAWKNESVVTGEESSAYSSDNEAGSSTGHESFQTHTRRGSAGEGLTSAQHLGPGGAKGLDRLSRRFSAQSGRSIVPVAPLSPATTAPAVSPTVSGLPLPLLPSPSPTPLAHLLQRIGPPPVGLPPEHFEQRISLIKAYILDQLPLPSPPTNDTLLHQRSTTLADEFDKLECLAEKSLCGKDLTGLGLEQAFEAARRACGLGGRSHFEARVHTLVDGEAGGRGLRPAPRKPRKRRPDTAPTVSSNDSTGSHSSQGAGAGRSPLLFGLVLDEAPAGRSRQRESEDTLSSEAETHGVSEKARWVSGW